MKIKTTVHIYHQQYSWEETARFLVMYGKINDSEHQTYVGEQVIEIEVPEDYDPRAQKIVALEKQKQKIMADFQKSVDEINERISKLLAVEFSGGV